jgi:hypothetical protein
MKDNPGQAKMHKVARVDDAGAVIPGTEFEMSQADWKRRDKTSGLVRLNDDGSVDTDTDVDDGGDNTTPTV